MFRKIVAVWVSLVMLFGLVVIVDVVTDITTPVKAASTLFVGGIGPGNYSNIQWAIDNATDGDTVFVYNGTYFENVLVNKTINLIGEDRDNTIINGGGSGDVLRIIVNWVNVTGFNVTGSGSIDTDGGIKLIFVQNCTVTSNNAYLNNGNGLYVYKSPRNNITNNIASFNKKYGFHIRYSNSIIFNNNFAGDNVYGIIFSYSSFCNISDNIAFNNSYGITVQSAFENNVTQNTMIRNGFLLSGEEVRHFISHQINTSNTVNGKPLYFIKNKNSINVPPDAGQIILANCTRVEVSGYNITNSTVGIQLGFCSNNSITNNNIFLNKVIGIHLIYSTDNNIIGNNIYSNEKYGILFSYSDNNNITDNSISNNFFEGIRLYGSQNNYIFYNTIINNTNQVYDNYWNNHWDNGYPFGGNYWSDYGGIDNFKGPNQDILGKDDIGDIPYIIDADSEDDYPLMEPYKPPENFIILKQGWNLISIPLIQEERNLTRVLGSADGWYNAVQSFYLLDTNDQWKHHSVGKMLGNNFLDIDETMGFWIHITQPGDTIFLYNGTQPTSNQSITLHPGWNMVGYPSLLNRNRTAALNNLNFGTDVDAIWTFDAATQTWQEIGPSDYFELGRGYWIHSKVTKVWDVPL